MAGDKPVSWQRIWIVVGVVLGLVLLVVLAAFVISRLS
jgi:hypothetical protein